MTGYPSERPFSRQGPRQKATIRYGMLQVIPFANGEHGNFYHTETFFRGHVILTPDFV